MANVTEQYAANAGRQVGDVIVGLSTSPKMGIAQVGILNSANKTMVESYTERLGFERGGRIRRSLNL